MRVYDVGGDDPDYAVVACLHGDERCGLHAVEYVREHAAALRAPVRLVVANERAVDAGVRAVDEDCNRVFPGDSDGDTHERRLAARVLDAVAGRTVLDLHSTHSTAEPFAIVARADDRALRLAAATGTAHVVDASYVGGGLLSHVDGVAVECGLTGTDAAAADAVRIVARFLTAADVLADPDDLLALAGDDTTGGCGGDDHPQPDVTPGALPPRDPDTRPTVYRIVGEAGEPGDVFVAENFALVAAGERYATRDGTPVVAEEAFVPVLMSTDGYDDKLGFRARQLGPLAGLGDEDD
ncbi:succinylglutamate desuccinylase/aspartoacylase family protein [Halobaculum sp. MBLA0147]|uniref:succinylglutamate desuccinylase/aspartoacylase domain-containing protein n=1 Tax=Halobaculum sp. MBLA0147 TaxID=3079934 RepID=UPI003526BCCF